MARNLLRSFEKLAIGARQYHQMTQSVSSLQRNSNITVPLAFENERYSNEKSSSCHLNFTASAATKTYHLPGSPASVLNKHTILDPVTISKQYRLPGNASTITEKLSPSLINITPKEDPHTLQKIIENGGNIDIMTMAWLVRLRKKMHRRHRQEKRKKRDVYITRKAKRLKAEKKELKIQEYEKKWQERGEAFDAEEYFRIQREMARKGGFWDNSIFHALKKMQKQAAKKKQSNL